MDLHVVGAGPSGCIAAISAIRKRNASVTISEEHAHAGEPVHCSGLFSIDGLGSLEEFVDYKKTVISRMTGAKIWLGNELLDIDAKKNIAFVCDRGKLDFMFAENAEKQGAKIKYKERVKNQFLAKNIIGADGPNSSVATHFGFPKIKRFVSTLQANIRYETEEQNKVEVFFSNSKFPGFFGWIIPHNEEEAEFGCGVILPNNANKAFERLLNTKEIRRKVVPSGAVIPIRTRGKTGMRRDGMNVLLTGDAAGQVKATTGGGVIFGGNCAKIAGENFDMPLAYEMAWRKKFGFDLLMHTGVQKYLWGKGDMQLERIGRKLRENGIEGFLSKKGHMDKPSKMLDAELLKIAGIAILH